MKILFICTGNAGRSQMAEAMFRNQHADEFTICSAGVEPWDDLHPMAVKLMSEQGISMAGHYPEHVSKYFDEDIDIAVTIGDRAEAESGHFRTRTLRLHWPINDPADADGSPDSEQVFRATRQAIIARFPELLAAAELLRKRQVECWRPAISTAALRPVGASWPGAAFRPAEHLPMIKKAGFKTIELCCYADWPGKLDFPWQDAAAITELAAIARDCDIDIWSVHTPELRLCAQDRADSEKVDVLKRFSDICLELGSRIMVNHYFPCEEEDYERGIPEILLALDAMTHDKPLFAGLETLQQKPGNAKLVELFKYLPPSSFASLIDTGHCNIAGDLDGMPEALGKSLKSLHLHDNDSSGDQHLTIGKGAVNWRRFAESLVRTGYDGPLLIESGEYPEPAEMYAYLENSRASLDRLYAAMPKKNLHQQ